MGEAAGTGALGGGQVPEWGHHQVWGRRPVWGIVPLCSQQPGQSCGSHLTGTDTGIQRKSVRLGWLRAGLWGSCQQQRAQRGWEGLGSHSQAQRGPSVGTQSCSWPCTHPGVPIYTGAAPPSLGHTQASIPFLSLSFYSLSTHRCLQGPLGHPDPPWCHRTSHTVPSPPELQATYLGALLPAEGPWGALTSTIHLGGG